MRPRWWYLLSLLVAIGSVAAALWIVRDPIDRSCHGEWPCDVSGAATTAWRLGVLVIGGLAALALAAVGVIAGAGEDPRSRRP